MPTPSSRRLASLLLLLPVLAGSLAWSGGARAQTTDEQRAEALFRDGRAAIERGDYAVGCSKFAESLKLTQRPSPLLNLANCEEHQGHLIAALAHWTEGIAMLPKGDDRIETSRALADSLARRIPRLTITLAPGVAAGAKVTLDGAAIKPATLGMPQPIDVGEHVVITVAPGSVDGRVVFTLSEGERREIAAAPGAASAGPGGVAPPPSSGLRTAGFVIGGVGLAGVVVGAVAGGLTIGKKNVVDKACESFPSADCSSAATRDAASSGKLLSTLSTISFAVGAAGLGAGVAMVLLGGSSGAPTASVGATATPGGGSVWVRGRF